MASPGVNVLRWGALVFGVFYGFSHQGLINSRDRAAAAQHEYDRKARLIDDAKQAWQKKTAPPQQQQQQQGDGAATDPEDPKFDLEAYLNKVQKENQ